MFASPYVVAATASAASDSSEINFMPSMGAVYCAIFRKLDGEFDWRLETTAEGALDYLRRERVDAMILDWDRPGMHGGGLLDLVRSSPATRAARVVVITGRAGAEHAIRARNRGADDYLSKPFEPAVMLARLRSLLRRW